MLSSKPESYSGPRARRPPRSSWHHVSERLPTRKGAVGNTALVDVMIEFRQFDEADRAAVIALWKACGLTRAWNDPDADIDRKLALDDGGFFVAVRNDQLIASVMVGYDGHRGWINYLAVDPSCRGDGIGRLIMDLAEQHLIARGCPKINLQIRVKNSGAIQFYERLGFSVDEVVSMGKRLTEEGPPPER